MTANRIWNPRKVEIADQALIDRIEAMTYEGRPPFNAKLVEMLGDISRTLLASPAAKRLPQYVALGYWLRTASLSRLREMMFTAEQPELLRVARGVALHLPPTNVDTIFVYSWALSVLCGNANVVRLSESLGPDSEWLVQLITEVVEKHGEQGRQLFCTYRYGSEIEAAIARHCDLRMIWGGDEKVAAVTETPIRPDGLSIGMPDRKSLSIISSAQYREASATERDALATNFFNDLFWFDQMGCGSPRLLIWLGDPEGAEEDFYGRLMQTVAVRGFRVETGVAISKIGAANDLLAESISVRQSRLCNEFVVNRVVAPKDALHRTIGGGFLCDWVIDGLDQVPPILSRAVQTITYFGLTSDERLALAQGCAGRGGYRIVPVGQALQFDTTWDGIRLSEHMTRSIVVR